MTRYWSILIAILVLQGTLASTGCKRDSGKTFKTATKSDCEPLCKRITQCGPAMKDVLMPGKSFETPTVEKKAMKAFTNTKSCIKSCVAHITHPEKGKAYAAFVAAQLPCLDEDSCVDFAKCLWKATQKMSMEYPIDEKLAFMCKNTCAMQKRCSKQLLTVLAGSTYTNGTPADQAKMEKHMEDAEKCELACRRHVIQEGKLDPLTAKAAACLNQPNCDEYAKCIIQQIPEGH